jgi:hypothetical protein
LRGSQLGSRQRPYAKDKKFRLNSVVSSGAEPLPPPGPVSDKKAVTLPSGIGPARTAFYRQTVVTDLVFCTPVSYCRADDYPPIADSHRGLGGIGSGPREDDHPPGHQARNYHDDESGPCQGDGLRAGEAVDSAGRNRKSGGVCSGAQGPGWEGMFKQIEAGASIDCRNASRPLTGSRPVRMFAGS